MTAPHPMPRISVVVATCDGASYLRQQLDSIVGQSRPPHEVVVVDDGSSDATWSILEAYARQYDWIRIHRNEARLGINGNFSKACALATGDLVFFSDQDDVWDAHKIERMVDVHTGEALLFSDAVVIDAEGQPLAASEMAFHQVAPVTGQNPWFYLHRNCVSGHNLMVTKALLVTALPFPQGMLYDQWLALVASLRGGVGYTSLRLCAHRLHAQNAANNPAVRAQRKRASRQGGDRRERFVSVRRGLKECVERLLLLPDLDGPFQGYLKALDEHLQCMDGAMINLRLLGKMIGLRAALLAGSSQWRDTRRLMKLCIGERLYWFG